MRSLYHVYPPKSNSTHQNVPISVSVVTLGHTSADCKSWKLKWWVSPLVITPHVQLPYSIPILCRAPDKRHVLFGMTRPGFELRPPDWKADTLTTYHGRCCDAFKLDMFENFRTMWNCIKKPLLTLLTNKYLGHKYHVESSRVGEENG